MDKEQTDITQTTEGIIITSEIEDEFKQEIKWQPGQEWDLVITKTYKNEDVFKKYENGE